MLTTSSEATVFPALPGAGLLAQVHAAAPIELPPYDPQACRDLMRGGSKSFFAVSLLLPARICAPASALYAYCRLADDEIDLGTDPLQALRGLQQRLGDVYAGRPQAIDVDRALASVVHRFAIPRELLDALLEGFLWDTTGRRYETLEDVMDYGARVAGTVGAMMALVMGTCNPHALARACELGVAMQLTNIARDVGEDARNGRLYLPESWLREAGLDPELWLSNPVFNDAIAGVVKRLLTVADELYARAEQGIGALPRDCRPAIHAARLVYAEIGRQIERQGLDSVNHRAVVPSRRKLALIARAATSVLVLPADGRWRPEPLPAIGYLVHAATTAALPVQIAKHVAKPGTTAGAMAGAMAGVTAGVTAGATSAVKPPVKPLAVPSRGLDERVGWVIELFERQRRRQLAQQHAA